VRLTELNQKQVSQRTAFWVVFVTLSLVCLGFFNAKTIAAARGWSDG
jgi:hypothetical protein